MESELPELIAYFTKYLSNDGAKEIMHYYNHGEYETALEGLFLELPDCQLEADPAQWDMLITLGRYYKLDTDGVFDSSIRTKITHIHHV